LPSITALRLRTRMRTVAWRSLKLKMSSFASGSAKRGRATDARLHTAVSS